jgi:Bacterial regulatory proteins, luxR family
VSGGTLDLSASARLSELDEPSGCGVFRLGELALTQLACLRLFISRHTVESHLKHVFVKLGTTSRVELAALVLREAAEKP